MEWTRAALKEKAKLNVKAFYWKSVLAAFVLSIASGSFGGSGGGGSSSEIESADVQEFGSEFGNEFMDAVGGKLAGPLLMFMGLAAITIVFMLILGIALSIFVFSPLAVGCEKYFLDASEGDPQLGHMGYAFKSNYMNIVGVIFLKDLFIGLWTLLFIIPGIIKAYQYRMIPYLLAEDPNLSFSEAKRLSTEMMDGEKWDAFVLDFSFILWELLAAITLNLVGIFWVQPYVAYTNVELYKVLRTKVPGPYYVGNNGWQE